MPIRFLLLAVLLVACRPPSSKDEAQAPGAEIAAFDKVPRAAPGEAPIRKPWEPAMDGAGKSDVEEAKLSRGTPPARDQSADQRRKDYAVKEQVAMEVRLHCLRSWFAEDPDARGRAERYFFSKYGVTEDIIVAARALRNPGGTPQESMDAFQGIIASGICLDGRPEQDILDAGRGSGG